MTGYTPLFGSLTSGTLCGRWPDIGLWPIVLSMADKNGVVDATQVYIASVTGLSVEEVTACMVRFCKPDPLSRSDAENGARLILLDEHRNWGWRIVNFGHYREKARLMAKAATEVESGRNRDRMDHRRRPPETAGDRRAPPLTDPSDSNADSNADSDPYKTQTRARETTGAESEQGESTTTTREPVNGIHPAPLAADSPFTPILKAYPRGTYAAGNWILAEREAYKRVDEDLATWEELLAGVQRYARQCEAKGSIGTQYVMGPQKFFARPGGEDCPVARWREAWPLPEKRSTSLADRVTFQPTE